jgi:hypothetical protein
VFKIGDHGEPNQSNSWQGGRSRGETDDRDPSLPGTQEQKLRIVRPLLNTAKALLLIKASS